MQQEKTIAIYSRKSKFTGKGESIGNQVELCRAYLKSHFSQADSEAATVYEDEGFSGKNLERPAFQRMMQAARSHRLRAVIVYRLDRISRNISDFSSLIEELSRLEVAFVSIREQFDTGTPMGRAMMYIASVFSQLERETIAERIRDNLHELAKTGRWLGGTTPTGYASQSVQSVSVDGKPRRACRLEPIAAEAETVRLIYRLFLEQASLTAVEAELFRLGCLTKNKKPFTRFSIRAILLNPVYLKAEPAAYDYFVARRVELFSGPEAFDGVSGILAYHRTDQSKGGATTYLPMEQWIVSVGKHPGLISARDWLQAQTLLEQNRSRSYRAPRSNEALLTGLLLCSCGSRMYPKLSQRQLEDGSRAFSYVCRQKEHTRRAGCAQPNLTGPGADWAVLEQVVQLPEDRGYLEQCLRQIRKRLVQSADEAQARRQTLEAELAERQKRMAALVDALAEMADAAARQHVQTRILQLHGELERLQQQMDPLQQTERPPLAPERAAALCELGTNWAAGVRWMGVQQRRQILRQTVQEVHWDGGAVLVTLRQEQATRWREDCK